ncbi:dihydropteroate synthase [Rubricoccus marinus]|uniref:Dihydropteroate synthase n=1 Tax=Rubricoccus marinus TaxID=716817 RepID=A0A259TVA9_9BACT|nr:dihydropteroate synthase [Rubricoccus marinus]OZC01514.1 dihydropteroate synthase [Rubricoccus marinus]
MPIPASSADPAARWVLDCRGRALDCRPGRAHVMGILNVTPDSFSDGGRYAGVQAALDRAGEMAASGAAIIDVGGESTRPKGKTYGAGAEAVSLDDELERVIPVVEAIARELPHVLISVDTYKGPVARASLRAGAHLVNDVTGLRHGVGTATAATDYGAPLVVMHAVGKPGEMVHVRASGDIVGEVEASLARSVRAAHEAGVRDVIVDAGFGFGKTSEDNLRLVDQTDALRQRLGRPVLVGASRKSTIGQVLGGDGDPAPVDQRAWGSVGLAVLAALRGASILRVHDVRETAEAVRLALAAQEASGAFQAHPPAEVPGTDRSARNSAAPQRPAPLAPEA